MHWKIQKICIFALEICFKENTAFFSFILSLDVFLWLGKILGRVCVWVSVLGFLALCHYQYRFSFRTDDGNCSCFLLVRNRSCLTGICKYKSRQSSLFVVFSQKKVMGRKKSF